MGMEGEELELVEGTMAACWRRSEVTEIVGDGDGERDRVGIVAYGKTSSLKMTCLAM